jgi:trimeric autotransporter adhesin
MNANCYKTVFSERLGVLVAVGEHATNQGKGQGVGHCAGFGGYFLGQIFLGALVSGFLWVSLAWAQPVSVSKPVSVAPVASALPTGGQVAQGAASISQAGQAMSITQSTAKAVINWQSFDIGSGAQVNVLQPNSQSVLLNRVLSDNPSQIFGQLNANGQVVLVNPRGIVAGSDGSVNTSGFTASTLNISDADFMQGRYRFVGDGSKGEVLNQGTIRTAPGGYVALLGASVSNEGQIIAPQGSVALGAAGRISVPLGSTGKIRLELSPASINASVANRKGGVIVAEGGQVYLQASAVGGALASVQQSGQIDTSGAQAGDVHLLADNGRIVVDGQIKANSSDAKAKGGSILIGRDVDTGALAASTDVSGATLENQKGFVETSGQHLVVDGIQVKAGEWLLDPTDITIGTAATSGIASSGTNPITQNPNTSGTTTSTISAATLASTLSGGTSVVVKTTNASGIGNGDITVASNIAVTGAADATLILQAERDIVVNAGVSIARTGSNKLNVVFNSDLDGNGTGAIVMNTGSAITSNGGNITLGGGAAGDGSGQARGHGSQNRGVSLTGASIDAGGGNIAITARGRTAVSAGEVGDGIYVEDGVIKTSGAGSLTMSGVGAGSAVGSSAVLVLGGAITGGSTGNVTVTGTNVSTWVNGNNFGVKLAKGPTSATSASLTSLGGNVSVTGTGGGVGSNLNHGVRIEEALISAGGSGTVTVTGTGGGTTGTNNHGVVLSGASSTHGISSSGGAIQVTGTSSASSSGAMGIALYSSAQARIASGNNADVTLVADSMDIAGGAVSAGTGKLAIQNRTAGTKIDVGGADVLTGSPLTLGISDAELDRMTGQLTIGRTGALAPSLLTISDNLTPANATSLTLLSGGDVVVAANKSITMPTAGGAVVLNSDSDGSGAGGIILNAGSGITSNGGNITLGGGSAGDGSGFAMGNASGSGFYGAGVQMFGADVNAGAGNILINGKGNLTNTGIYNYGVFINSSNDASSGTGSRVRTSGGNVVINGTGGGAGGSYANVGIQVDYNSEVSTQGAGALTMTGIGGSTSTGGLNNGMYIARVAKLTTVNGQMNLTGTGATSSTSGGSSEGLYLLSDSSITSTGTGNISITASGGLGGANNNGLRIDSGSTNTISAASGNVDITTTGGAGGSFGLNSTGSTNAIRSTTGNVTVTSDSVNWDAATSLTASAGTVTIQNRTAGTLINVGGADVLSGTPLTLGLNSVEYGRITAANTVIGRNDSTGSGNMTVNSAVSTNTMGNLTLRSGNNITVGSGTGITKTAEAADTTLKLLANHEIAVNSNVTASGASVGKQNILLNSDSDGSGAGAIVVSNAASINSNGGNITMGGGAAGDGSGNARGYTSATNGNRAAGILLNGVSVSAGGGNIAMNGQGSATTTSTTYGGFQAMGVRIIGSTVATSGAGNIAIQGQGGNGSDTNAGVAIDQLSGTGSVVTGSTMGNVTITGTGGVGTTNANNNYNFGTWMAASSRVTTTGGSVNVTGTGTGQGSNRGNAGVMIQNSANLGATGAGTVTITGVGGNSNVGGSTERNNGVDIFNNGSVTSVSGAINITGTNTSTTNPAFGIALTIAGSGGGKISSSGNAPITLNTDTLSMDSSTSATINAGTGTVTIQNKTAGTRIDVGGADVQTVGGETLAVNSAELRNITAGNVVIGNANAGDLTVSSNVTTNTTTGNVTLLTGGNMAINATLNVGDDPATTPAVEASNTLTLNAVGASSAVTDGTSGAIKAANLELLGATAAYTLDSASNAVTRLAGNTGSVTFLNSATLRVDRVNTINSANTVTGTVGLTTTGNVNLSGTTTLANTDGLLVSTTNPITVTGPGSITLTGNSATTIGLNVSANVSATTGTITINGSSNSNTGVYLGNGQISSKGAIAVTGTSASGLGVNLDDASGSVTSLTGGSNFAGADAIAITGSTSTGAIGVLIRRAVTNNSTNGATTIKSTRGNIRMDRANGVITNGSTAGAINLFAGNETNSSTAGIVANAFTGPGPQIVQNANADVVLTTDGTGNLSSPKIAKNSTGAGDIVLAAGKLLAAGVATGGQVQPVAGNSVTNSGTGSLYVYSGSPTSANTAAMSSLDASLANLYLSAVGANVQNADANVAYATSGVRNTIAGGPKAQVLFREKVSVGRIGGATVAKTYGDSNTGSTETAALWTDMTAALKTANATSGVSNVNSTSTTAGTLQVTRSAIVDTLTGYLQSTAYSTSQKLKANSIGYSYSGPTSSKYTTALTAGQSAIVTVALKALPPSVTANNKVYNDSTAATLASQTVSGAVSGDVVSLNSTGATFDTQHVGTGKTVTATGLSLSGTDATNYSLPNNSTTTTANVTVKALTLTATTDTKTYDGTTSSSATVTVTGLEGDDKATASQAFASKNVMGTNGSSLQVNSGYTINDGNSGNNYSVSTSTATGTISQAALTVTANADAKFVTQADATGYNGVSYSGLVNGETSTVLGGTLNISRTNASTHVGAGTYAGTLVASGLTSGNYNISYANGDYTIVPANQLLIRTNNVSTVYGTAPTYSATAQYLDGSNVIHTLSQSGTGNSVTFSDGAGGSVATVLKPYSGAAVASQSGTGNTVVGTYAIKDANAIVTGTNFVGTPVYVGNLTVTPKEVSTSAAGLSKVYDGTTAMGNATLSLAGQLTGDQLGVSGTGAFSQKNVGTNLSYAFKNVALTGSDRGNYYLSGGNNLTGTNGVITPAPLTIVGTQSADKNYDGTTQASVTAGTVSGLVGSETLSIAKLDGQFDTPTPGKSKAVKVVYTLANGSNGGLASNYTWSPVFTTAQVFNPAKDQRYKPELPAVADTYSRVSYLGFNAKTGAAVAGTSRTPWQANNSACTASRIEECICEQPEDPSVEICVAPTRAQAE